MPKHSPGPWSFGCKATDNGAIVAVTTADGYVLNAMEIAEALEGSLHPKKVPLDPAVLVANFRLLAAAPTLLASLEELSEWMRSHCGPADGVDGMLALACLAIANAKGTPTGV